MIRKWIVPALCVLVSGLILWNLLSHPDPYVLNRMDLDVTMGTDGEMLTVARPGQPADIASNAMTEARQRIDRIESLMSNYRADSDVCRLNRTPVGQPFKPDRETLSVLIEARTWTPATDGAFDITCGPLMELWNQAGKQKAVPTPQQIADAKADTGWANFQINPPEVVRLRPGARLDLGGIAKKHALDEALAVLQRKFLQGGLVNIGGDITCFGTNAKGRPWNVAVKDPFDPTGKELLAGLLIPGGAVCTSGNYERFVEIDGRRYSHIKDPRTGMPADLYPSVTVIGPTAVQAGVWATALSVLGPDGFKLLPKDGTLEVLMVTGTPDNYTIHATEGFAKYIALRGKRWK